NRMLGLLCLDNQKRPICLGFAEHALRHSDSFPGQPCGSRGVPTDICVPISELPGVIAQTRQDVAELDLIAPLCGHVGDGNFHLCVLVNPEDEDEKRRIVELNTRMIARAHALGGTCTGEHGIGTGKMDYLVAERGTSMMALASLKRALDPRNIMNPGKVLRVADYQPYQ
ncbi:FAD-linked oxidase C-terminal domain-containing protein, partial [Bradyrhizobium sp. LeoA1S1]